MFTKFYKCTPIEVEPLNHVEVMQAHLFKFILIVQNYSFKIVQQTINKL